MSGSYGLVPEGIWRSRFKVEWRRFLKDRPDVRLAQMQIQRSLLGKVSGDKFLVKPIMVLDKAIINPVVRRTSSVTDAVLFQLQKIGQWLPSFDCFKASEHERASGWKIKAVDAAAAGEDEAASKILDLVQQNNTLLNKFKIYLWKCKLIAQPSLRWSFTHCKAARQIYRNLGAQDFEISDLVHFAERSFIPKLLECTNNLEAVPANRYWLDQHAAKHVQTLLRSFQSAAAELYGNQYTDNLTYQTEPLSVVYSTTHVKRDTKPPYSVSTLPSIVIDVSLRAFSNNSPDSPVASGPKTVNFTMALCLLPNPAKNDRWPVYVQDAMITAIDMLKV